jgi:hypothetical protein
MPSISGPGQHAKYEALKSCVSPPEDAEKQSFIDTETESAKRHWLHQSASHSKTFRLLAALNVFILFFSIALAAHSLRLRSSLERNRGNALLRMADWYSPVHDLTQINIVNARVNGTLLDTDHSIFRQQPFCTEKYKYFSPSQ